MKQQLTLSGLILLAVTHCTALTSANDKEELSETELSTLALAVVGSWPEVRGSFRDTNNNTMFVSPVGTTWVAQVNNVQYSFSATQTIRSYTNASRRYFYECTAQTGFGCTVGTFSAVQWTFSGSTLAVCEYHSNQSSLAAAQSGDTSAVNPSNLTSGCEGFAWNTYTRVSF